MRSDETPEETSQRLDREAQLDREVNAAMQKFVIDVIEANGVRIFELERNMWDCPDLTVRWVDGNPVFKYQTIGKEVTISLNGTRAEIEGYATKVETNAIGDPYLRRWRREAIGQCAQHDLPAMQTLVRTAVETVAHWKESDLTCEDRL